MQWRGIYGMHDVPFGTTFSNRHGTYAICGVKPRSRKFPILGKHVATGKVYKFQEDDVARWTGAAKPDDLAKRALARIEASRGLGITEADLAAEARAEARAARAEAKAEAEWERKVS